MKGRRKIVVDEQAVVDHVNGQSAVLAEAMLAIDVVVDEVGRLRPFAANRLDAIDLASNAIELRARASQLSCAASSLERVAAVFSAAALVGRSSAPLPSPAHRVRKSSARRR